MRSRESDCPRNRFPELNSRRTLRLAIAILLRNVFVSESLILDI